jgi:hypothetical protein
MSNQDSLTIHVCDPSPYSSFEEQWGAQLGEAQARQADEDWEVDQLESERVEFCDLLSDPDFEPDLEHEADLVRFTDACEPEIVQP